MYGPKSLTRWRRLTALANGSPPLMLLEDLVDLTDIWESTGRAVPRARWVPEVLIAVARRRNSAVF